MSELPHDPDLQERILVTLRAHPGLTSTQIADWLGLDRQTVSWEVVVMTHWRLLAFEGHRWPRYSVAPGVAGPEPTQRTDDGRTVADEDTRP